MVEKECSFLSLFLNLFIGKYTMPHLKACFLDIVCSRTLKLFEEIVFRIGGKVGGVY